MNRSHRENCGICHALVCEHTREAARARLAAAVAPKFSHLSIDLSLSNEDPPALRSGYDAPETTYMDGDGEATDVERWCSGARVGQPVTAEERRAIADAQIERWRVWRDQ